VVRNPALCKTIRRCLPYQFTEKDIKKLTDPNNYQLKWPSGVPIYDVTMVCAISDPVKIVRRDGVERYYFSRNNHHMEILEDLKTGKWSGYCWDMFRVARRVLPPKNLKESKLPMVIGRKLEQLCAENVLEERLKQLYPDDYLDIFKFYKGKKFVMSLAIGETVYLREPQSNKADYFVVFKIEDGKMHFVRHTDARPAEKKDEVPAREEFSLSPIQLSQLEPEPDVKPYKVRVSPLGEVTRIDD